MIPEALFAILVIVAMPWRAWRRYRRRAPPTPTGRYLIETVILIAVLTVLWRGNGVPPQALGLWPSSALRFLIDLVVCLGVVLGIDAVSVWRTMRRLRSAAVLAPPRGVVADALQGGQARASFMAVSLVGAVWEESCFRATVFLLMPATVAGHLTAIAVGSILFGAHHLRNGRTGFAYASRFGVMFALLYLATGNLIAVIVAHAAGNITTAFEWAPRLERARLEASRRQTPIFLG